MSFTTKKSHLERQIYSNTIESVLSILFRKMLFQLNITPEKFNYLMINYLNKSKTPGNVKERSTIRGNLKRELLDERISWKVFCKGLIFLNVKSLDITIKLTINGFESTHRLLNCEISKNENRLLSQLFTVILSGLEINEDDFNFRLNEAFNKKLIRNSLKKELVNETMTWKVFCKGLAFLNVTSFTLITDLLHSIGHKTSFDTKVVFSDTINQ